MVLHINGYIIKFTQLGTNDGHAKVQKCDIYTSLATDAPLSAMAPFGY